MTVKSIIQPIIRSIVRPIVGDGGGGYDYLITDDATWTSTFALGAATLSGKTIAVAPGSYTAKTISSFNPTNPVTIKALNPSSKPVIDRLILSNASKIVCDRLELIISTWQSGGTNLGALQFQNAVSDITVRNCDFVGNYRGTVGFDLDPTIDTYPEYACILPIFNSSGVVTGFDVTRPNVGDLMANGTYSMVFNNYSSVTFTVAPVATFTVSSGVITGTTLTSGGSSNATDSTGSGIRSALITWTGQRTMASWLPSAWRCSGGTTLTGTITFEDNTFELFNTCLKPIGVSSSTTLVMRRNFFDKMYSDVMSFSGGGPVTITDNFATRPFHGGDAGDPHTDFVQLIGGAYDWPNIQIERNILMSGTARGSMQGVFLDDTESPNNLIAPRIVGNAVFNRANTNGINLTRSINGYVYQNVVARFNPLDGTNVSSITLSCVQDSSARNFIGDNIQETGTDGVSGYSQVTLGLNGATIAYGDVFADHTANRTTRGEIAVAYAPEVAYAGKGAFANSAYINHSAYTTDRTLEPTWVDFTAVTGQTASSVSTSNWSMVRGGVDGRAISVTGGEYRIADDASGTNATSWGSSASTVNVGKFVQVRLTNSGLGSTTTTATLTIGSNSFAYQSTTASTASFSTVDNQGTAYSSFNVQTISDSGIRKVILAMRFKPDAITSGANIFAANAAGSQRFWFATATSFRYQFQGSTRSLRPSFTPTTNWQTHIITLDFTQADGTGCYWATVEDGMLLNNAPGSGGTFNTAGGTSSFSANGASQMFGTDSAMGLFGEGDGGGTLFDGQFAFFWMHWGDATLSIPDITNATVRNGWSADLIGADGSGPLGLQPKLYYTGNAAEWNAGFANLGSLTSRPLNKGAGTYV